MRLGNEEPHERSNSEMNRLGRMLIQTDSDVDTKCL
jgi:hypothetical protein